MNNFSIEIQKKLIIKNINEIIGASDVNQKIIEKAIDNFVKTYDINKFYIDFEPIKQLLKKQLSQIKGRTLKNMETHMYNESIVKPLQKISEQLQTIHKKPLQTISFDFL